MRNSIVLIALSLLISCVKPNKSSSDLQLVSQLDSLTEAEDFFRLKAVYLENHSKLSEAHSLYFSAIIHNVFNKAEVSNKDIDKVLADYSGSLNDTLLNKLYWKKIANHINLYEYAQAAKASEYIQSHFSALNDSSQTETLQNEIKIWRALSEVPEQEIIRTAGATIPMTRDKVGLFNIDVAFGDTIKNLLFDTGANFSVVKRSLAEELEFRIIEADFYVTAATGTKVSCDIAIADALTIGGILFKNVFFLILEDEDLSFPQIDYYINGAIGFPVIEAMDEIRITKDNQIIIPEVPVDYGLNNFALNGLMPIIAMQYRGDTLRLHFDTGAKKTSLYPPFYNQYKDEIDNNYGKETFTSGSGGGMVEFEGYVINDIALKVGESAAELDSLHLHIEHIGGNESHFHGNLGQDYIKQFDEMIMSFKYSSILFK